ncbi:MAG: AAA family ATPase, partial [Acidimicrobiales bacterium]
GPAGTGKSRALDAARRAWQAAGYDPIGLAPSAMAARVLSGEAGVRSETLAKFLYERERGTSSMILDRHSVVILDETGMARTDDLAKLLAAVEQADAKLVLVGDPRQLGNHHTFGRTCGRWCLKFTSSRRVARRRLCRRGSTALFCGRCRTSR